LKNRNYIIQYDITANNQLQKWEEIREENEAETQKTSVFFFVQLSCAIKGVFIFEVLHDLCFARF